MDTHTQCVITRGGRDSGETTATGTRQSKAHNLSIPYQKRITMLCTYTHYDYLYICIVNVPTDNIQ